MTEVLPLQEVYRGVSTPGLENQISQLKAQMGSIGQNTPEYEYDQLQLAFEERELEIRKENQELDPTTQKGAQELAQIMANDPTIQQITGQIKDLMAAYPNECTSWGIPM